MGCHALLQGIFLTQGLNACLPYLPHHQADSLPLCHLESHINYYLSINQGNPEASHWSLQGNFTLTIIFANKVSQLGWMADISSVQFSSVTQSCPTLCDPMNSSTPGLPVHHQLPDFTQTHVHKVSDAIQSSYPLLSPSPPIFNLSQHQGLFK